MSEHGVQGGCTNANCVLSGDGEQLQLIWEPLADSSVPDAVLLRDLTFERSSIPAHPKPESRGMVMCCAFRAPHCRSCISQIKLHVHEHGRALMCELCLQVVSSSLVYQLSSVSCRWRCGMLLSHCLAQSIVSRPVAPEHLACGCNRTARIRSCCVCQWQVAHGRCEPTSVARAPPAKMPLPT